MKEVAVVGLGNMGLAIQKRLQYDFQVVGIGREDSLTLTQNADIVILAIKPQSFPEVASKLRTYITNGQLVISIMAGVTIRKLTDTLGTERVVRMMPNLALKTGQSMTAWHTTVQDTEISMMTILNTWGQNVRLEQEEQFDAFTALAGSGPAYYFEFARLLEEEAIQQGFSAQDARRISLQTLRGAASVLEADTSTKDLVHRVSSKGGTTEAALAVLRKCGFEQMVASAIEAACKRSKELGQ